MTMVKYTNIGILFDFINIILEIISKLINDTLDDFSEEESIISSPLSLQGKASTFVSHKRMNSPSSIESVDSNGSEESESSNSWSDDSVEENKNGKIFCLIIYLL